MHYGIKYWNPLDYEFPELEEYFVYTPKQSYLLKSVRNVERAIKIAADSITYCTSGLVDKIRINSFIFHKAIKSLNQLRMIEDSLVIYRLSRAPERYFLHRCR